MKYEKELAAGGIFPVAGVDEAGRGPLAGPVVAAAVILPLEAEAEEINDSKKLTEKKRDLLYDYIMSEAVSVGVGIAQPSEIDSMNILNATHLAMKRAVEALAQRPAIVLVDGLPVNGLPIEHRAIVKGDSLIKSIGAASIIAKVTRDRIMYQLDREYPMYDFGGNKGYGTKKHIAALREYGITEYHRKSFEPIKSMCGEALFPEL